LNSEGEVDEYDEAGKFVGRSNGKNKNLQKKRGPNGEYFIKGPNGEYIEVDEHGN